MEAGTELPPSVQQGPPCVPPPGGRLLPVFEGAAFSIGIWACVDAYAYADLIATPTWYASGKRKPGFYHNVRAQSKSFGEASLAQHAYFLATGEEKERVIVRRPIPSRPDYWDLRGEVLAAKAGPSLRARRSVSDAAPPAADPPVAIAVPEPPRDRAPRRQRMEGGAAPKPAPAFSTPMGPYEVVRFAGGRHVILDRKVADAVRNLPVRVSAADEHHETMTGADALTPRVHLRVLFNGEHRNLVNVAWEVRAPF